jgi:hypothetical protein
VRARDLRPFVFCQWGVRRKGGKEAKGGGNGHHRTALVTHVLDAVVAAADCVLELREACAASRDESAFDAALRALGDARGILEELVFALADAHTGHRHADAIRRLRTLAPLGEAP